ncbi:MAG: bifunctional glutamate N-acetyltransferase/amino-acid acetyltransferase ArgJ [Firmicutes bacterium]|nr:bifunctional glutamate N-acetyltransferase/amino-acid acetyltransferase ArgJ [Bacillota bacterium]MCD7788421.1 bifunctional glutamate N-acetyltransferase/amino-acid acetyltransferase ArgJ [Bacillota bacterium]MCD7831665.1 bifunctional glutamate N-acetyltransferase/amino-acid acetyltransferase ArgJ [Bacillota bacterium]
MEFNEIEGGVCAPSGFSANGIHCGIRKNKEKRDLSLIVSDVPASAAAVYTTNLVKGAPIIVTKRHLENGVARAIICNSGNANTCNENGIATANEMCRLASEALSCDENDIIVASTGVIGQPLDISPIKAGMHELVDGLGGFSHKAAEGIMTTDTKRKEIAISFDIGGVECKIGGIAKGSGMIHPNMATMLVFVTTDAKIDSETLHSALAEDVKTSFNMITVDGDTSTNDTVAVLANGMAGNAPILTGTAEYETFCNALHRVTTYLCRMIAADGEGATKLITCRVSGMTNDESARVAARAVVGSSLVKAAMFGCDANWGRVMCALGYSGVPIDVDAVDVTFASRAGEVDVCLMGTGTDFSEDEATKVLSEDEIEIIVTMHEGVGSAVAWGCDLTYDYVKINGDYRT